MTVDLVAILMVRIFLAVSWIWFMMKSCNPCFFAATAVFGEAETKHLDEDNDTRTLDSLVTNVNKSSLKSKSQNKLNNGKVKHIGEDGEQVEHSSENSPQDFTSDKEPIQCALADLSDLTPITNILLEDSVFSSLESIERLTENSHVQIPNSPDEEQQQQLGLTLFDLSPTSPVSPLSLNSCNFELQTQPDNDHTSHIPYIEESLQMDIMENLEVLDSEEYLQQFDQMDMAVVWDIHNEQDLSCFQDSLPFLNTSHTDFAMDKQATCGDGDICGGLQQITTLLENSVKNMNVEDELRSNGLAHGSSSGHHNQARQTRATVECYINQPEIITAANKEGQYSTRGTRTVSEQGNISSHILQELKHDPLDQTQTENWEKHLSYYPHAPSEVKDPHYTWTDEEKKMIGSGPTLNPTLLHSNPVNSLTSSTGRCYAFDIPLQVNSNCIGDSCSFSNYGGNQCVLSFDGVAQSFPAPYQNPHPHSVSTPPLNDDWLFSNIVTEVDFTNMVRSHVHTYCCRTYEKSNFINI